MQIQWISVDDRMPEEGKKVYIQGESFVTQAYYHVGMYWQDANRGEQRFPLAAVTQWAEVDHVQEVVDYVADKAMEHERHGLQYTPTETLEQMAEDYSKGRWMTEGEVEAAYRGYLAGYCQALEINSSKKLDSWISVKERLPEIGAPCLVTCHEERYAIAEYDGIKWTTLNSIAYYHPIVTHWQELPEVPKEGE